MTMTTAETEIDMQDRPPRFCACGVARARSACVKEPASPRSGLRDFMRLLRRRKGVILLMVLLFVAAGWLSLNLVTPKYKAEAFIRIDSVGGAHRLDHAVILSEVEVLRSRSLARHVIQKYGLVTDVELNKALSGDLVIQQKSELGQNGSDKFKNLSFDTMKTYQTDTTQPMTFEVGQVVNNFLKNVRAHPVKGSYVIKVEYVSSDAEKAAKITNAIIDTYQEQYAGKTVSDSRHLTEGLEKRLSILREQVRMSEEAVEDYRRQMSILAGSQAEMAAQRWPEPNIQLIMAKAEYAEAVARLSQVEEEREHADDMRSAPEVLESDLIAQLKIREIDAQRKLSDLSARYGSKHPLIVNAKKELFSIQAKIKEEVENILDGVENKAEIAAARVRMLEADYGTIKDTGSGSSQGHLSTARLQELMQVAESNRQLYEQVLQAYKSMDRNMDRGDELQGLQSRVLSYATVPAKVFYPNKGLFLSLIGAAAFILSILLCLMQEKISNTYRNATQIERATGRACFGMVPKLEKVAKDEMADYIIDQPSSSLSESIRSLRTVLKLRAGNGESQPHVVSITSSFPGEGKTTLSSWLGRSAAKSGERVILLDCDLRRPSVHNMLPGRRDKTLVEYLTGQAKLDEVIVKDLATGLHKIYARSVPNSALDLIDSERMKNLIESLRKVYDLVILDTPACLAVSDAGVLSLLSDYSLYCVNWDKTPKEAVDLGVKQFSDIGYDQLAFVLTNVDIYKHASYGYGDTPYYYSHYREYYQN